MDTTAPRAAVPLRQDARTIGLIGMAHATSHFFHMLLPPLFPWLISDFSLNYSELGLLVSIFFVISALGQASAGFLVDKVGARPVLFFAVGCFAAAALAAALAPGYFGLAIASALAGLGNASFHPVDFTIMNKRVSHARLGHAFSVHGITGNLGWAAAPVFMAGIASATGSWRTACFAACAVALLVLAVLWWHRDAVDDSQGEWTHAAPSGAGQAKPEHPMAFLRLPSVWLCFSFFFFSTCALAAMQSFASPALGSLYGLPLHLTALVITGYMLFGAAGMVAGGFLVSRVERLERTIAIAMCAGAALLALVGTGLLPGMAALWVAALAGVGTGVAGPSRDMLIKRATPPGATGRVYGTVYSGLDVGFATAAPVFGWVLDQGEPAGIFVGSALALAAGIASAALVGTRLRRPAARAAA
ncbi:MAG: MFS transporter [Burkholderiaceae bacterium]|nr:MFS transporter [Burkholderiaceae bacterium]